MSTTTRILLCFLLLIAGGFYFLLDKLTERVERQYLEAAEEPMVDMARIIAAWMEQEYSRDGFDFSSLENAFETAKTRPFEARIYNLLKTRVDLNVYVTNSEGIVLFDSNNGEVEGYDYHVFNDVYKTLRGDYGARSTRNNEEDELSSVMFVGAPVIVNDQIVGMVSVSKPQASMFAFIDETEQRIRFYGWSIMLLTMFAAVLVSHLFSSPIRKLTAYAKAVRKGDRVALPRLASSDVRTLGRALDEMRDALEDRKYVETYVQTLTHEMKSPVSAILGAIELLQQDFDAMPAARRSRFLENIQSETRRLVDIIDQLLALSAIESRKALDNPFEVRLSELIEHVCALQEHQLHLHALHIEMDLDPACPPIPGDPFLLEIAVGNMIQNAIDFSPTGGTIRISLRQDTANKRIELTVEDEGPGVPDYAIEKVFDRFYSLPHPKSGKKSSGLGLCFVREAAELHGGKASLHNRSGHNGTCACLSFQQPR